MADEGRRAYDCGEPQPPHITYENYSGSHPIPTVQNYVKGLKARRAVEEQGAVNQPPKPEGIASTELQVQEGSLEESREKRRKELGGYNTGRAGGRRKVYDPVTGNREVEIEDASKSFMKASGDPKVGACAYYFEADLILLTDGFIVDCTKGEYCYAERCRGRRNLLLQEGSFQLLQGRLSNS